MADLQVGDVIRNPNMAPDLMGPRPTIPQFRTQPVQPGGVQPQEQSGGLINFFRSLFHRQNDLDDIMKQADPQQGLRSDASSPAQVAFPNINSTMYPQQNPMQAQNAAITGVRG